jgi:hypothetical protein
VAAQMLSLMFGSSLCASCKHLNMAAVAANSVGAQGGVHNGMDWKAAYSTALCSALQLAGTVLCNIMRGHKQLYDMIKSMPGGETTAVGIVHNVFWLEPKGQGPLYAHVR